MSYNTTKRAKAIRLKGEGFSPSEWKNKLTYKGDSSNIVINREIVSSIKYKFAQPSLSRFLGVSASVILREPINEITKITICPKG